MKVLLFQKGVEVSQGLHSVWYRLGPRPARITSTTAPPTPTMCLQENFIFWLQSATVPCLFLDSAVCFCVAVLFFFLLLLPRLKCGCFAHVHQRARPMLFCGEGTEVHSAATSDVITTKKHPLRWVEMGEQWVNLVTLRKCG